MWSSRMVTERSLSINARVITSDRSALGKVTIRGLRAGTEAVRFNDPVSGQPANIASTKKNNLYAQLMMHIKQD